MTHVEFNALTDKQIEELQTKSEDELIDIVGAFALSQEPRDLKSSLAIDGAVNVEKFRKIGRRYLRKLSPVMKDALCGQDGLMHYMEQPTIKDVLQFILPVLGYETVGAVPTAIIAIGLIILRSGVRKYCKGYKL